MKPTTFASRFRNLTSYFRNVVSRLHHRLARAFTFDIVQDPDLLHAYAGKNYYKFITRRFNIAGFFFSVIYLFFRKLYVAGIAIFLLDILLINLIRDHVHLILPAFFLGLGVNVALSLLVGFLANEYYLFAAGYKIGRLKRKYPGRSHAELRGICEAKGGTNSIALTFGFFAKIISSIVMIINLLLSDTVIILDDSVSGIIKTVRSEIETITTEIQKSVNEVRNTLQNTFTHTKDEVENNVRDDFDQDARQVEDAIKREVEKAEHKE